MSMLQFKKTSGQWPFVSEANPLPVTSSGGGGGGAVTVADGADVTLGSKADARSTATDTTAITAMSVLKQISFSIQAAAASLVSLLTGIVLAAGSAVIGKVGIDQTTPGTTNGVAIVDINSATTLAGNGVTGTGSLRVTTASDNTGVANWGHGATAATVPGGATLKGTRGATANPTAVTDGQMVAAMADKLGRQVVIPGGVRDQCADQTTSLSNTTTETTIVTAAASIFNDLLSVIFANTGAAATEVSLRDTTAGSVRYTFFIPAGDTRGVVFQTPVKQTTVNTNWTAQCVTATTAMKITAQFVKNI